MIVDWGECNERLFTSEASTYGGKLTTYKTTGDHGIQVDVMAISLENLCLPFV